ncbi:MAG: Uma2 family endonuclease [Caldilineaceae bacterium]
MSTTEQQAKALASVTQPDPQDWSLGWRYETVQMTNGRDTQVRVPLTEEEARHPQAGYVMPEPTEHDRLLDDLCDMLRTYYESHPNVAVFRNLVFTWDHPAVKPCAPDVVVVPNIRERDADRTQFVVVDEGTRPNLAIEIVSRSSRADDRVEKVRDYALAGVQEYVYIDHTVRRGNHFWELAGFRLQGNQYLPILPDEDGALYLESINLRIGLDNGQLWLEDAATGKDLLTNLQVRQALQAVEARALAEAQARQAVEARLAEVEAQLQALQKQSKAPEQS